MSDLVMSIGKQIAIPTKKIPTPNQYLALLSQISWYFLGIFRYLEYGFLKIWFNMDIFRQNKIGLVPILFLLLPFHWYRFGFAVSACQFPENDTYLQSDYLHIQSSLIHQLYLLYNSCT